MAISLYTFTNSARGSLFSTRSPAFTDLFVDFFYNVHSDLCEVIFHCSFDLHYSEFLIFASVGGVGGIVLKWKKQ